MIKKLLSSLLVSLFVLIWIFQESVNNYWSASPIRYLNNIPGWNSGTYVYQQLSNMKYQVSMFLSSLGNDVNSAYASNILGNKDLASASLTDLKTLIPDSQQSDSQQSYPKQLDSQQSQTLVDEQVTDNNSKEQVLAPESSDLSKTVTINDPYLPIEPIEPTDSNQDQIHEQELISPNTLPANRFAIGKLDGFAGEKDYTAFKFDNQGEIVLNPGDQVLIAGDSMQQGISPYIRKYLTNNYKIFSKDIAKQSTGLISPKNLNWNKTIAQELANNPKYKLLVVFMGANDNYGLYNPKTGKSYAHGSIGWQASYLQRIMSIMYQARTAGVKLIWITVPNIRDKDLNAKMQIINKLIISAAQQYGVAVVDANQALGLEDNNYHPSISINNKLHKTRADDGIHFTPFGGNLIASAVNKLISVKDSEEDSLEVTNQTIKVPTSVPETTPEVKVLQPSKKPTKPTSNPTVPADKKNRNIIHSSVSFKG